MVAAHWRLRQIAKAVIPRRVVQEIVCYRKYKPAERALYIRLKLLNVLALRKHPRKPAPEARSFLFVCFGNIMRSPMCEALMKRRLADLLTVEVAVTSAGLNATPGTPAHPWSVGAAREFGIDLSQHRSRLLRAEMVDDADVILAMDYQNQVELLSRYPAAAEKVFMLSAYAGDGYRSAEIRDPFYGNEEETKRCYRVLANCVNNLAAELAASVHRNAGARQNAVGVTGDSQHSA